jgi:hypothetical protein
MTAFHRKRTSRIRPKMLATSRSLSKRQISPEQGCVRDRNRLHLLNSARRRRGASKLARISGLLLATAAGPLLLTACGGNEEGCSKTNPISTTAALLIVERDMVERMAQSTEFTRDQIKPFKCSRACQVQRVGPTLLGRLFPMREVPNHFVIGVRIPASRETQATAVRYYVSSCGDVSEVS